MMSLQTHCIEKIWLYFHKYKVIFILSEVVRENRLTFLINI